MSKLRNSRFRFLKAMRETDNFLSLRDGAESNAWCNLTLF